MSEAQMTYQSGNADNNFNNTGPNKKQRLTTTTSNDNNSNYINSEHTRIASLNARSIFKEAQQSSTQSEFISYLRSTLLNIDILAIQELPAPLHPWCQFLLDHCVNCLYPNAPHGVISPPLAAPTFKHGDDIHTTIDYIFASHSTSLGILRSNQVHLSTAWTDHDLLYVDYRLPGIQCGPGSWRFNPLLLDQDSFVSLVNSTTTGFFARVSGNNLSPCREWDQFKQLIQDTAKQYSIGQKQQQSSLIQPFTMLELITTLEHSPNATRWRRRSHYRNNTPTCLSNPIKLLAYADDLLIFLQSTSEWDRLLQYLDMYGLASNGHNHPEWHAILDPLDIYWHDKTAPTATTYLRYLLYHTDEQLQLFLNGIYNKMSQQIQLLQQRHLSVLSKSMVANSLILAKIWHILQVCVVPPSWLSKCNTLLRQYLLPFFPYPRWSHACASKQQGGLGIVDLHNQHRPLHFTYLPTTFFINSTQQQHILYFSLYFSTLSTLYRSAVALLNAFVRSITPTFMQNFPTSTIFISTHNSTSNLPPFKSTFTKCLIRITNSRIGHFTCYSIYQVDIPKVASFGFIHLVFPISLFDLTSAWHS
ncbi:hypothetical protein BDC45DRAFT_591147 [Circinella umbellata]|nr:hypothetical protein BDC45DRAFT_591147 [Circinella umbellata]